MSWAVFLAIAGAAYFYYNQKSPAAARGRSATRTAATGAQKDATLWSDEDTKSKGSRKSAKAKPARKTVSEAVQDVGNKAEAALSAAATAGADAVESLSSSAPVKAVSQKIPSGKDVSDMLGSQTAAPSILSIKASDKPSRSSKPKAQKAEVPPETKKQRQNKKKTEEAKAAREEEEKERLALQEKQRRAAREARGEPAKNGLQAANAPTSSPWTAVPSRGAVQPPVVASSGQLLDTFDTRSTSSSSEVPTNGTASTADASVGLSEEEQMRLAMADSAWTTVPKGGKKQRKPANEEAPEESSSFGATEIHAPVKPVRPTQALTDGKKPSSRYQIFSEDFTPKHNDDSDWPVV